MLATIIAVLAVSIFFVGSGTLVEKLRQFDALISVAASRLCFGSWDAAL